MSKKYFDVENVGVVCVTKRRKSRRLRLRIASDGQAHVSIPYWAPYRSALAFVSEKQEWIVAHQPNRAVIADGDIIGRHHQVVLRRQDDSAPTRVRVNRQEIVITIAGDDDIASRDIQDKLAQAAKRALTRQAEQLLPARVDVLAKRHNFSYRHLRFRAMKSRWGSCSSERDITLNVYLLQLDAALIDYVILHELLHTEIPAHGAVFWHRLAEYVDGLPSIRRQMRALEPRILPKRS